MEKMNKLITLKKWVSGLKPCPYIIDLNPTDYCNQKCLSCWQRNPKYKLDSKWYELSDERLLSLVDEGFELGVKWWEITGGGESLLRPVTVKIMKKIKNLGMHGSITTNGTMFSEKLLKDLVILGWDLIAFSIDGPDAKIHDYLRGQKGAFNKAMKALKMIKILKAKLKTQKPITIFNTVLSNKNYDKIIEMIRLAKKTGCEEVNFETMTLHSKTGKELMLNKEQIKKFQETIDKTKKIADKLKIKTNIQSFKEKEFIEKTNFMKDLLKKETKEHDFLSVPCYEPWYHLVIKVDGTAGPCCIFNDKKMNVKNKTLNEIWHGKRFNKIRKKIEKKKFPKYCSICNAGQVLANRDLRKELKKVIEDERNN